MAEKLKIYACSGIGDTQEKIVYDYWLDNINPINSIQAVNALNVDINLHVTELNNLELTKAQRIKHLNTIDVLTICLYYAQEYANNSDYLETAGRAIGKVYRYGHFKFDSEDNTKRDAHLDELFERVATAFAEDDGKTYSKEFAEWWDANVMALNKYGLTEKQRQIPFKPAKAISGTEEDALNDQTIGGYLQNGATYFIYTYFTDEQLKELPTHSARTFRSKRRYQLQNYMFCKDVFTRLYGTEQKMQDIIRAGIIERYKSQPEEICADIAAGGNKYDIEGVGAAAAAAAAPIMIGKITVDAFVSILLGVLTFLTTVIMGILAYCAKVKELENAAVDRDSVDGGTPNPEDITDALGLGGISKTVKKYLPLVAIVAGVVLLARN